MQTSPATQLPNEENEAELLVGLVDFHEDVSFDPVTTEPTFTYVEAALLVATSVFRVGAADSNFSLDEILFEAAREDAGQGPSWNLFLEIEGENLPATGTAVRLAGGDPIVLSGGGRVPARRLPLHDRRREHHPQLGSRRTHGLGGTAGVDRHLARQRRHRGQQRADVAFTFDCTNCKDMDLDLFDVATDGMAAGFGFGELNVPTPNDFTNPILFGDMSQDSGASELPAGENEVELVMGLASFSTVSFDPPTNVPSFSYTEAGTLIAVNAFTVPEASAGALALAAFGTVAGLARSRSRSSR
jgi:hypothetical protein